MKKEKKNNKKVETPVTGGWYRFKNITGSDLLLQRPLTNGKNLIPKNGTFEADGSYIGSYGIQLIENLSHYIDSIKQKENIKKEKKETSEKQIIIDESNKPLEFFESDGKKIIQKSYGDDSNIIEINLTKKELIEYAELKGVQIQSNWTKERILAEIRSCKKS